MRLPTRQEGVENLDKVYCMPILSTLPVHTLIPALCSTLYLPPFLQRQNHPTPPHTEIDQVPRRFRKIRDKKPSLTRSQLILIL